MKNILWILTTSLVIGYLIFNVNFKKEEKERLAKGYCYGYLKIEKIDFNKCMYEIDNKLNSLNYGLEMFHTKPYVILGHSGNGFNAIFNNLKRIEIDDVIELSYNNQTDKYKVIKKLQKLKSDLLKLESDLILATCDQKIRTEQTIIYAEKIS